MTSRILLVLFTCSIFATLSVAQVREWTDVTGHYRFTGELIAHDDSQVIIERDGKEKGKVKELVSIKMSHLSDKDVEFLDQLAANGDSHLRTWTLRNGLEFRGSIVEYVQRKVAVRRVRGKAYVNDSQFAKLPGVYRKIVPTIVNHFEGIELESEIAFEKWVKGLRGKTKTYEVDGVLFEFENGDLYALPIFVFGEDDQKFLKPGWDAWAAAHEDTEEQELHSMSTRAHATMEREQQQEQREDRRQVARLNFQLEGYEAGLFDLWEVAIVPGPNVRGYARTVVVPGRDSDQARATALTKFPGCRAVGVMKVRRRD